MDDTTMLHPPARPAPSAQRPLLGLTVLAVEDSRYASEALRLLCLRSGARLRRADCIASAERHLVTYRADVAIVDLGLPDGSGLDLIQRLAQGQHRPHAILATSGIDRAAAEAEALQMGADGFLGKPLESLAEFQQTILVHLPSDRRPIGVRALGSETVRPDILALAEDLTYAARMIDAGDVAPDFVAAFVQGVARSNHDEDLYEAAHGFAHGAVGSKDKLRDLIAERQVSRKVV